MGKNLLLWLIIAAVLLRLECSGGREEGEGEVLCDDVRCVLLGCVSLCAVAVYVLCALCACCYLRAAPIVLCFLCRVFSSYLHKKGGK